jgi:poly-gamma-glutamate synthesis protein (capsule biosynthesis protein)
MKSALDYVALAERRSGPIPRRVPPAYVWGEALEDFAQHALDLRNINLETAVTLSEQFLPKGINYRMNPANLPCLLAARIDCCALANNHVLDWGLDGLSDTLAALTRAGLATAGAGRCLAAAEQPSALLARTGGRLVVHAVACPSSGVPPDWAATADRPGVHFITGSLDKSANRLADAIARHREPGDIVVVSVHWGSNWGSEVGEESRKLAHFLIDEAGVDVVHGHSSHHPRGIEMYRDRAILYGCGDLLNDYEGIGGHAEYRPNLTLAYILSLNPDGTLGELEMLPYQLKRFRLDRAAAAERRWLAATLDRACRRLGTGAALSEDGALTLVR